MKRGTRWKSGPRIRIRDKCAGSSAAANQFWQTDLFTSSSSGKTGAYTWWPSWMTIAASSPAMGFTPANRRRWCWRNVLRTAMTAYGVPPEMLTDNGSQYVTWRGKSLFARELEKLGVHQIVASPRRPQGAGEDRNGSGVRCGANAWSRPCSWTWPRRVERIGLFIDYYNLQRPHQGIEGLVPADRFFYAAPEVLKTLKQRVAENARELARQGVPKPPLSDRPSGRSTVQCASRRSPRGAATRRPSAKRSNWCPALPRGARERHHLCHCLLSCVPTVRPRRSFSTRPRSGHGHVAARSVLPRQRRRVRATAGGCRATRGRRARRGCAGRGRR